MTKKRYFSVLEACNLAGISRKTLYLWEAKGKIPEAKRNGIYDYRYYTIKDVNKIKKISKTKWKRSKKR